MQEIEMSMDPGAGAAPQYQTSWAQDTTPRSKIIVVDLAGPAQSSDQVNNLRKGEGQLFKDVERIVENLVATGTVQSTAQPVVVVVRELYEPPPVDLDDDDDDDLDDEDED
jgi:Family of unknown function (DUF6200)